jgi:hypothetical protein
MRVTTDTARTTIPANSAVEAQNSPARRPATTKEAAGGGSQNAKYNIQIRSMSAGARGSHFDFVGFVF